MFKKSEIEIFSSLLSAAALSDNPEHSETLLKAYACDLVSDSNGA